MGDCSEFLITPEMVRAGADELIWYDINENDPKRIVAAVLVAMGAEEVSRGFRLRKRNLADDALPQQSDLTVQTRGPGCQKT